MEDSEFNRLADTALTRIETTIDESGSDADFHRSGNVLEIEFDNGHKIIINRHDINQEIWVAAPSGGFHYAFQNGAWTSHRDDSELYARLKELFAEQGEAIHFNAHD